MKISVVIPAYNEEISIGDTLQAILDQDYEDFEVIVVDNNSTDKTAKIVEPYLSNPRLRLVKEERLGILYARQCGLEVSTGEIIAQLDADCLPDKNWLSKRIEYFNNKNIVAVTGPYYYYDASWFFRTSTIIAQRIIYKIASWCIQKNKKGAVIIGGNTFIRKDALLTAGGYNTNLEFYAEDTDTACRIVPYGYVKFGSNLVLKTSARRFKTQGSYAIIKKYIEAFLITTHKKTYSLEKSKENIHPR